MADYLNNVATEDAYVPALELGPDFQTNTLTITVANAAVLMQLAVGVPGNWRWIDEREFLVPPQSFSITRVIGARFRSAVTATPAQVLAALTGPADPDFGAGLPFTGTISPEGGISSSVIVPAVALASFPPPTPVDGQTVLLVLPSSYDPVGGKSIRWLCTYDASLAMWHVAGPPLYAEVLTQETTTSAVYADLATVGPAISLPRPGDYDVDQGFLGNAAASNGFARMAYVGAGIAAGSDNDSATVNGVEAISCARTREKVGLTTATALKAVYLVTTGGAAPFQRRWLQARPLRIT